MSLNSEVLRWRSTAHCQFSNSLCAARRTGNRTWHDRGNVSPAWDGAGTRARAEYQLEGVSDATRGPDRVGRFFHHRSLDATRPTAVVILFFMELSTHKVEIAGIASSPSGLWMTQIGRNLTDEVDGLLKGKQYTSSMIAIRCLRPSY